MRDEAIYATHPTVVSINAGTEARDADGNIVNLDEALVQAKISEMELEVERNMYKVLRLAAYPDFRDYLDGIVKGDQAQIDAYIAACQAVKAKYPKGAV
jgi:hypothetical protein